MKIYFIEVYLIDNVELASSIWIRIIGTVLLCSHVGLFETPWTVACQDPLSMTFPRQEYWSGLPSPPPEDLRIPGVEPASPTLAGEFFTAESPGKPEVFPPT